MSKASEFPKRLRVTVTAEDIAEGERGSYGSCPIALALHRKTGRLWTVYGSDAHAPVAGAYRFSTAASAFVYSFDTGLPVAPATFVLRRF